ncbi:MAG: WYL domain-containing protein [Gemmatimonadaceae bacterium]|nr:WYL domain-containing protein [Gemmatimonadaceae bacterium]
MPMRKTSPAAGKKATGGTTRRANPSNLKLQRWIDLVATLLSHHYGATAEQLRRQVPGYGRGIAKASIDRTFERDKDELRAFGIPIEERQSEGDDEHRYSIDAREMYLPFLSLASARSTMPGSMPRAGYRSLKSLAFEPDEMSAVLRGCDLARDLGDSALTTDIDAAVRKLTFDLVLAPTIPDADRPHPRSDGAREHTDGLRAIGEALLRRKRVSFAYRTIGRENSTDTRTVEPYGLYFQHGHWYLAARDIKKGDVRNFRVSRMADVTANDARHQHPDFAVPASFRLTEHAAAREPWELGDGDAESVVLEFRGHGGAARAAEKLGAAVPGHARRRSFQVRRRNAFARWVLSFAGDVVPVSRSSFEDEYREMIRRTLASYEEPTS